MSRQWRRTLLMTSALAPLALASAMAGPNGATVVGGSATVQGQGTANVVVNQTSQSAIINWNTFNIGAGETTRINMPSTSSVELDRVTGGLGPSQILGSLYSNGQVFLVNPDGILFGAGSRINVGGLLATTNDISNANFMAGRYKFTIPGYPAASIVNQGSITAQTGGFAALVAPGVRNTGTITAKLGTIALASGNAFTLDLYGDNLITLGLKDSIASQVIDVSTGKPLSSLVSNAGMLKADGGKVELTAVAARRVVNSVINNAGNIEANTIGTHNGMIVLGAATAANKPAGAPTQTVKVSGTLSATGNKGTTGGTIVVTGENVQLNGANINASGQAGGGAVLIGGDWGGGNPNKSLVTNSSAYLEPFAVPTASTVSIDAATTINASATTAGNGGKVIVWSNDTTSFYGTILAQGGSSSGNGGFVETSGHSLDFTGARVDTSAPQGTTGAWLLDPYNLVLDFMAASTVSLDLSTTNVTVDTTATGYSGPGVATVGAGDIEVASNIIWGNSTTLTMSAYRNITIDSGVTITSLGSGNLILRADNAGTGVGAVNFNGTGKVDFSGGTGTVSIFYDPEFGYTFPLNYAPFVLTNGAVPNQFSAYMLVNNVNDLQNIQQNLSGTYALGAPIDASGTAAWNGGAGFLPIGTFAAQFNGVLYGNGYTINELSIANASVTAVGNESGLFGFVGSQGVVSDVGLTNANVTGTASGLDTIVGGLAAENIGSISGSYVTGSVRSVGTGVGAVAPYEVIVGGLVGYNAGSIIDSYSAANVSAAYTFAGSMIGGIGGLAGVNGVNVSTSPPASGSIVRSFAVGNVSATISGASNNTIFTFGGLVAENILTASISKSYARGSVQSSGATLWDSGGLVGFNSATIQQSYATGLVGGSNVQGGLIGYAGGGATTNSYWDKQTSGQAVSAGGTGLATVALTSGLPNGFDPTVWGSTPSINNGYPYLLWTQASPSGTTTSMPSSGTSPIVGTSTSTSAASSTLASQFGFVSTNYTSPVTINTTIAGSTAPVIRTSQIPLPGPNDVLTWPAIGGIVNAAIAPLLQVMPADLASSFQSDVEKGIQNALADQTLTIKTGGLNVIGTVLSGVISFYINQIENRALSNCGGGIVCAIQIGSGTYALQVMSNSVIDYITTPELWVTGLAGVAAAGSAGIVQSTAGNLIDLTKFYLGQ